MLSVADCWKAKISGLLQLSQWCFHYEFVADWWSAPSFPFLTKSWNCAISEKRVDVEWSRWSTQIVVNTTTKLKLLKTGRITIVESAHGGVDNNRTEKKVYWFRRVYEKQTWSDAIEKCATLGGRLLADLDGTTFQLDLMINNMPAAYYWLGLSKDPNVTSFIETWMDRVLDDNPIIWSANEPNDPIGQPILAVSAYMDNQCQ